MNKNDLFDIFETWLIDNGLYDNFVKNLSDTEANAVFHKGRATLEERVRAPKDAVMQAFLWRATPEGEAFWLAKDSEWKVWFKTHYPEVSLNVPL